jgi:hypothetical protein
MVTVQRLYKGHDVDWVTASPLWKPYLDRKKRPSDQGDPIESPIAFRQPAILRFTNDTFMEDFLKVATTNPEQLHEWHVQKETWRIPAPIPLVVLPPRNNSKAQVAATLPALEDDLTEEQRWELNQQDPVKLYQPANQRFYLVTANLVCRIPGLPDKMLNFSKDEKVSFVLRRLIKGKEYALIDEAWYPFSSVNNEQAIEKLQPGEQQFPMFPVTYYAEADGHKRRMFAGLVPVSGREKYINAEIKSEPPPKSSTDNISGSAPEDRESQLDQLMTVIDMDVLEPWGALLQQFEIFKREKKNASNQIEGMIFDSWNAIKNSNARDGDKENQLRDLKTAVEKQRDQFQIATWYILLDLAKFIKTYLNPVWRVINQEANVSTLGSNTNEHPVRQLFEVLNNARFESSDDFNVTKDSPADEYYPLIEGKNNPTNGMTLVSILRELNKTIPRNFLETTTLAYDPQNTAWPTWPSTFLLCGSKLRGILGQLSDSIIRDPKTGAISGRNEGLIRRALAEVLKEKPPHRIPLVPLAQKISKSAVQQALKAADDDQEKFCIRCVFERPNCPPSLRQVVSQPTIKFQMASYFDPDAPARPIRIPMPVDTTPAGLRKFTKNTMFAISDSLACQIELARKLTFGDLVLSVLPWPFHKDLPDPRTGSCKEKGIDIGKLCTLSIPIITICALILMIIIVLLLDQIFKWVPYLIYCLPLPGLKAKKGGNS